MALVINTSMDTGLVDRTEFTKRFFKDVHKYPTLTQEQERYWFDKYRNGKTKKEREDAREYIIKCNQRFVVAAAKNWATTETLMDYVNEANIGLMEAIDDFDLDKGVKFLTFAAFYIKRSINTYRNGALQIVKRPNRSKTFHVMSKAKNGFLQEHEREPTLQELFEIINNKYKKDIRDPRDLLDFNYGSIDSGDTEEEEARGIGMMIEYNTASASINTCEIEDEKKYQYSLIRKYLNILSKREQTIIKMYFGLYEDNGLRRQLTPKEIGDKFNLTQERVRQLIDLSLERMRSAHKRRMATVMA